MLVLLHCIGSLVVVEVHQILHLVGVKVVVLVVHMLAVEMHNLVTASLKVE